MALPALPSFHRQASLTVTLILPVWRRFVGGEHGMARPPTWKNYPDCPLSVDISLDTIDEMTMMPVVVEACQRPFQADLAGIDCRTACLAAPTVSSRLASSPFNTVIAACAVAA